MSHFIRKCTCGIVLAQCRCPSLDKTVTVVSPCEHKPKKEKSECGCFKGHFKLSRGLITNPSCPIHSQPSEETSSQTDKTEEITFDVTKVEEIGQPSEEKECTNCKPRPHGVIKVGSIANPHCIECGRDLEPNSTALEWEEFDKEFEKIFNDTVLMLLSFIKGEITEEERTKKIAEYDKKGKALIKSLLATQRENLLAEILKVMPEYNGLNRAIQNQVVDDVEESIKKLFG